MRLALFALSILTLHSAAFGASPKRSWARFLDSPVLGTDLDTDRLLEGETNARYSIFAQRLKATNLEVFLVQPDGSAHHCEWKATFPNEEYASANEGYQEIPNRAGKTIRRKIPGDLVEKVFLVPAEFLTPTNIIITKDGPRTVWEELIANDVGTGPTPISPPDHTFASTNKNHKPAEAVAIKTVKD